MTYSVVIVAAGSSTRFGKGKKEYLPLPSPFFTQEKTSTVLSVIGEVFLLAAQKIPNHKLSSIILVRPQTETSESQILSAFFASNKVQEMAKSQNVEICSVLGGKTRQNSVFNALNFLHKNEELGKSKKCDFVAIHDGARPWLSVDLAVKCLKTAFEKNSCAPVIDVVDTIKGLDTKSSTITTHYERSKLGAVQTPQVFSFEPLFKASKKALETDFSCTDDTQIWSEFSGQKMFFCKGDVMNKKITYAQDLQSTDTTGATVQSGSCAVEKEQVAATLPQVQFRTGFGYDLHALVEGRRLMLGGVQIESNFGEAGHSDGDVLLHAICDSLLGASAIGDIGEFFPPSDPKWKNADSAMLLKECWQKVKAENWKLCNLDCVINIEKPKILPYRQKIIESIADILGEPASKIFVKAKTGEKLGEIGTSKAVQVWANCLLQR